MYIDYNAFEHDRIFYGADITDIWDYIIIDDNDDEIDEEE